MSSGTQYVQTSYARELAPLAALRNGAGVTVRAECSQCGSHCDVAYGHTPPPEKARKGFLGKGWDLRKKPVCPECAASKPVKQEKPIVAEVTKLEPKAQPTDAAKKAKRLIFMALEDYYDDAGQCYKDGWTDEKIAKECNASPTFVRTIRETDFGPLKEPQEIRDIRSGLDALTAEAGKLRSKLDAYCRARGLMS